VIRKAVLLRYARSLAEVSLEAGAEPKVAADFAGLVSLAGAVPEYRAVMRNPVVPMSVKNSIVTGMAQRFGFHPFFGEFLRLLVKHHRMPSLPDIHDLYREEVDRLKGVARPRVVTSRRLDPAHQDRLLVSLKQALRREVVLDLREDPGLIGGLRLEVAGMIFDGSVRHQLERLREGLASS
jgi:F-type H+-transporting ATPase subunit delta